MRKLALFGVIILLAASGLPLPAQEAKPAPPAGQTAAAQEPPPAPPGVFAYNSEGRRDPFKDLLGGRDVREKAAGGIAETPIEDLILMGIIKSKKGFTAIVGTSQGFPSFVNVGDRFSDGYVLSIDENKVVFRKTHERGIPLMRARDITKEITPEER